MTTLTDWRKEFAENFNRHAAVETAALSIGLPEGFKIRWSGVTWARYGWDKEEQKEVDGLEPIHRFAARVKQIIDLLGHPPTKVSGGPDGTSVDLVATWESFLPYTLNGETYHANVVVATHCARGCRLIPKPGADSREITIKTQPPNVLHPECSSVLADLEQ